MVEDGSISSGFGSEKQNSDFIGISRLFQRAFRIVGVSIPDYDHCRGSFGGRAFPLWRDTSATEPNLPPRLLPFLSNKYKAAVTAEDLLAYLAAVAANPAFIARFESELVQPTTNSAHRGWCNICRRSRSWADRHLASHIRRAICRS
jgi:Type ISP C-terminal specificity domain